MKKPLIVVIIVLLSSVVGYLAIDRSEKNAAEEHSKAFKAKYFK